MNYFIDTEFLEGTQNKTFLGINIGKTKPTIDLISIGIVCEDGREYYAISKDFNLKEAWNRYDWKQKKVNDGIPEAYKDYWLRENVLKPIWNELVAEEFKTDMLAYNEYPFSYSSMKILIKKYGKTNKQIAQEIKMFISFKDINGEFETRLPLDNSNREYEDRINNLLVENLYYKPKFYAYYADYDWVVFCWLFGKMTDLPKEFPMYCIDLKQELDRKIMSYSTKEFSKEFRNETFDNLEHRLTIIEKSYNYPKQTNEHNAIADAKWNKKLYNFLNTV